MRLTQIDAFTDEPFKGNPAAVCRLERYPAASRMQSLARELNLSETAFLVPGATGYHLRWFTPTVEVDLCGHATLASAHFLWQEGETQETEELRFSTKSGELTARRDGAWIEMDFPSQPPIARRAPRHLLEALRVSPRFVGTNEVDWLIEIESEAQVRELEPDLKGLGAIEARGFILTARSSGTDFDFVSRFFAPASGVDEDPVTGSAHCCLGPYWAERLDKRELVGYQASARGGIVRVVPRGDRVLLAGQAVTVLTAELRVDWP